MLQSFVNVSQEVSFGLAGSYAVATYYNDDFPAAAPAFSETQARVTKKMKLDSIFSFTPGEAIHFSKPGLYLLQQDTASAEASRRHGHRRGIRVCGQRRCRQFQP